MAAACSGSAVVAAAGRMLTFLFVMLLISDVISVVVLLCLDSVVCASATVYCGVSGYCFEYMSVVHVSVTV